MPLPLLVDLDAVAGGLGGFRLQGQATDDLAGRSLAAAGDVNGDGIDDLVVGAPFNDGGGAAYVVLGRPGGATGPVDLDAVAGGTGGFAIAGRPDEGQAADTRRPVVPGGRPAVTDGRVQAGPAFPASPFQVERAGL